MMCPVIECKFNGDKICSKVICSEWGLYRSKTGKCETCGASMDGHSQCDACSILSGKGHLEERLFSYRGRPKHKLCEHCIVYWKTLDQVVKRKATWEEFLDPEPLLFVIEVLR